jgi:hypothetical protein
MNKFWSKNKFSCITIICKLHFRSRLITLCSTRGEQRNCSAFIATSRQRGGGLLEIQGWILPNYSQKFFKYFWNLVAAKVSGITVTLKPLALKIPANHFPAKRQT